MILRSKTVDDMARREAARRGMGRAEHLYDAMRAAHREKVLHEAPRACAPEPARALRAAGRPLEVEALSSLAALLERALIYLLGLAALGLCAAALARDLGAFA